MSQFTVREPIQLRPDPDPNSTSVGTISPGDRLTTTLRLGDWVKVEVNPVDGDTKAGWIPAADMEEVVGQTVKLRPEPLSDKFTVVTGTIEELRTLENWRKVRVTHGTELHSGWIDVNETEADVPLEGDLDATSELDLGANEVYRQHILKAREITGIDAAALAALIDAEASKISEGPEKGQWNSKAFNSRSKAAGLTQFLPSTWLGHAKQFGTLLNQVAKDKGYVTGLNAVASGKKMPLLNLRFDPELSIVSGAEYGVTNLKALEKKGFIPDDASDDENARFMYLAHHEGLAGATRFLTQTNSSSLSKFNAQVGRRRAASLVKAAAGNVALAYRNWLNGYMDKKIQPDRFRRAARAGSPFIAVSSSKALTKFMGAAIPIDLLGGRKELVKEVQEALSEQGYLDPPVDGLWGSVSNWALDEFCQDNSLTLGSGFSPEIARALLNPTNPLPDIKPSNGWFDKVISYMNDKGLWICRHPNCTNIVYLEGINSDGTLNDDRPNAFNDLRVVFTVDGAGALHFSSWEGTTEPGRYWTERPMDRRGAARIAFGQYKSWTVGKHPRKKTPSQHEALVQESPVSVYRDLNRDYKRMNDKIYTGNFGINQHWGYDNPKTDLGRSSAGCLVGRTKSGHREFMRLIKEDARYRARQSYRFMTAILPGEEILS